MSLVMRVRLIRAGVIVTVGMMGLRDQRGESGLDMDITMIMGKERERGNQELGVPMRMRRCRSRRVEGRRGADTGCFPDGPLYRARILVWHGMRKICLMTV